MDRPIQEHRSGCKLHNRWTVLQCWMWIELHSCSLSGSKKGVMPLGDAAERAEAHLLWVKPSHSHKPTCSCKTPDFDLCKTQIGTQIKPIWLP